MLLRYLSKSAGGNYKANIPKTPIWIKKRRTPYRLSACLLKYIHLSVVGNKMKKI
jgi:hypothetical protein